MTVSVLSVYYEAGTVLTVYLTLSHVLFTTGVSVDPHFIDEEN